MEWIWVVLLTALISFCLLVAFRAGQMRGYKEGARRVLKAWKETLNEEDINNG